MFRRIVPNSLPGHKNRIAVHDGKRDAASGETYSLSMIGVLSRRPSNSLYIFASVFPGAVRRV